MSSTLASSMNEYAVDRDEVSGIDKMRWDARENPGAVLLPRKTRVRN